MQEQFVVFRIGAENYGINIKSVLEIIKEAKPTGSAFISCPCKRGYKSAWGHNHGD